MQPLQITRTLRQSDFDRFAELSGDSNPIHVDAAFSARTSFGRNVSHGMLLYAVLWGMLRSAFPTARQLSQSLMFPNPAYADEPLIFTISEIAREPGAIAFSVQVTRQTDDAPVCTGSTTLEIPT